MSQSEMEPEAAPAAAVAQQYLQLANDLTELNWREQKAHLRSAPVHADDVIDTVARFRSFKDNANELPCLVAGSAPPIPIDVSSVPRAPTRTWLPIAMALAQQSVDDPNRVRLVDAKHAISAFKMRLAGFLSLRLDTAQGQSTGDADIGLEVRVSTHTVGGRVFYSPATLFRPDDVFGAPTSPVVRPIGPGRYLFGVERPDGQTVWDRGEHRIPPNYDIRLAL